MSNFDEAMANMVIEMQTGMLKVVEEKLSAGGLSETERRDLLSLKVIATDDIRAANEFLEESK